MEHPTVTEVSERLTRLSRRLHLDAVDLWFAALRAGTFCAGLLWWALAPAGVARPPLPVLAAFLVFGIALYAANTVWPGHLRRLYLAALAFDLLVVALLVRFTEGYAGDLHLAFILLVALHAFYFGLAIGLVTAGVAAVLYALAVTWPPPMPGFALRIAFFVLVGLCMGVLSRQARRRQQALEEHQERLIRSDRLATGGELAAGLAHELRNPLAGISGALHVLAGQLEPADERRALLADLQAQIARMNRTLTDLLRHARPAEPQLMALDVNAVIEQSLQFLPRSDVDVTRRLDPSLPPVWIDPNLLHQAFLNILVNARQAMPDGGRITVETRRVVTNGPGVEIVISDTGTGIHPDDVDRIFQPFFTTKAQGTGLGLAIAARVVEQHGGRITVASGAGRGASFTIRLPMTANGRATGEPRA